MGTNHRGMPVGDNHRPTPRLAKAYADLWNAGSQYAEDYRSAMRDPYSQGGWDPIDSSEAQELINDYRDDRNAGVKFPGSSSYVKIPDAIAVARGKEELPKWEHDEEDDHRWDDGGKRAYLFDHPEQDN